MSSYTGKHAEYYDIFYAEKPYAAEAAFVHACLQQHASGNTRRLLELACGSGRHALELEKLGYQIVATDYSEDLLAVARRKAAAAGSQVDFLLQDMRHLDVDGRPFDAAYCLFDSIGYVQTNVAILQVLQGVASHLRAGGLFVFEFWHAAAMLRGYEPHRERSWTQGETRIQRTSRTRLNVASQLAEVSYTIVADGPEGRVELSETQVNRYFLVQEMAAFLEGSGFEPVNFLSAYETDAAITEDTWHILAIARKVAA
ncbi:MAG: class I SAM-dependent methyltransferase [Anaerolineales bacterium]|nr:class I SAM-dependent methyltransferase [Anaerolineales bacterium]